jgi:hypothetical protein
MADIHRELPKELLKSNHEPLSAEAFIQVIKSSYAKKGDLRVNAYRENEVENFQENYLKIMKRVSEKFHGGNLKKTLIEATLRASVVNRTDRITGDGVLHLTSSLIRNDRRLSFEEKHEVFVALVENQTGNNAPKIEPDTKAGKLVHRNLKAIRYYRDGF